MWAQPWQQDLTVIGMTPWRVGASWPSCCWEKGGWHGIAWTPLVIVYSNLEPQCCTFKALMMSDDLQYEIPWYMISIIILYISIKKKRWYDSIIIGHQKPYHSPTSKNPQQPEPFQNFCDPSIKARGGWDISLVVERKFHLVPFSHTTFAKVIPQIWQKQENYPFRFYYSPSVLLTFVPHPKK